MPIGDVYAKEARRRSIVDAALRIVKIRRRRKKERKERESLWLLR
jgi:hypothetical protein